MKGFVEDLRDILVPQRKWHYLFHLVVILVASSYWIGSLIRQPEASWAEITMYRPGGDNQVIPVVTALSKFNFGDPTDALHYGKGTAGSQVVPLLPYAIAQAVFGKYGYFVADVFLSWVYFLCIALLLRRCNFGSFSSLAVGAALATRFLPIFFLKLSESFIAILSLFGTGTWEWGIPNLLDLQIFSNRIPRPMGTELFLVLLLYFMIRQWHERTFPSFRLGLAIGLLLTLLMQGDPFSVAAVGLLLLWVMGWTLAQNNWQIPWRFLGGMVLGTVATGWYFLWQQFSVHPDSSVRFGMADYPRDQILFLPGYGPLLRVGVVCVLAALVIFALRSARRAGGGPGNETASRKEGRPGSSTATPALRDTPIEKSVATFFMAFVVAAWLAQPIQLLLVGKGAQIYHYMLFVLPMVYSYSIVILGFNFCKLSFPSEIHFALRRFSEKPQWAGATVFAVILTAGSVVGMHIKLATVSSLTNARQETNIPWAQGGDLYRPCFRALEKQFREHSPLQEVRSISTFCYEVNFLLAGFYDKRAYLPDNAYSTLSDDELETRLLETLKIFGLPPEHLGDFVQANFILNYWLGCAKYWMTTDYQYSSRADYTVAQWSDLQKQAKQSPWLLCMPISELKRLSEKYTSILARESDHESLPDAIIVGVEKSIGMIPDQRRYQEIYTNNLFSVYTKNPAATAVPSAPVSSP